MAPSATEGREHELEQGSQDDGKADQHGGARSRHEEPFTEGRAYSVRVVKRAVMLARQQLALCAREYSAPEDDDETEGQPGCDDGSVSYDRRDEKKRTYGLIHCVL
jgi:hypothetical protein